MKQTFASALAFAAMTFSGATGAHAENIYDLESARANARAGGPVSFYDYELLERWGHLGEIRDYRHDGRRHGLKKRRYVDRGRWRR